MAKSLDFEAYMVKRLALIKQLEKGELDKVTFIEANVALYLPLVLEPPGEIHTHAQGMFYYQYYNTLAKYHQMRYRQLRKEDLFEAVKANALSDRFYALKEHVTLKWLQTLSQDEFTAYYVKSASRDLDKKLVEIEVLVIEKAILHTLDDQVIRWLEDGKYINKVQRESKIASYINTPYYQVNP